MVSSFVEFIYCFRGSQLSPQMWKGCIWLSWEALCPWAASGKFPTQSWSLKTAANLPFLSFLTLHKYDDEFLLSLTYIQKVKAFAWSALPGCKSLGTQLVVSVELVAKFLLGLTNGTHSGKTLLIFQRNSTISTLVFVFTWSSPYDNKDNTWHWWW